MFGFDRVTDTLGSALDMALITSAIAWLDNRERGMFPNPAHARLEGGLVRLSLAAQVPRLNEIFSGARDEI